MRIVSRGEPQVLKFIFLSYCICVFSVHPKALGASYVPSSLRPSWTYSSTSDLNLLTILRTSFALVPSVGDSRSISYIFSFTASAERTASTTTARLLKVLKTGRLSLASISGEGMVTCVYQNAFGVLYFILRTTSRGLRLTRTVFAIRLLRVIMVNVSLENDPGLDWACRHVNHL